MSMHTVRTAVVAMAVVVASACVRQSTPPLDIATTTSVQNSGLLEAILPHYTESIVRVHAAGSGRALDMLNDRVVDLVISHAPETEARQMERHPGWSYQKLAFNRFVVVGPERDPAGVREATGVLDAFRRIANSSASFVSRSDASGTHEREQMLWKQADVMPSPDRLLTSGRGMAVTLRQADERQAYTLADEATFWQLQRQLDLVVLSEGDDLLLNTYAVLHPGDVQSAARFAAWLTRGDGRLRIEQHLIEGRPAFRVWPLSCPGASPAALPCRP